MSTVDGALPLARSSKVQYTSPLLSAEADAEDDSVLTDAEATFVVVSFTGVEDASEVLLVCTLLVVGLVFIGWGLAVVGDEVFEPFSFGVAIVEGCFSLLEVVGASDLAWVVVFLVAVAIGGLGGSSNWNSIAFLE